VADPLGVVSEGFEENGAWRRLPALRGGAVREALRQERCFTGNIGTAEHVGDTGH